MGDQRLRSATRLGCWSCTEPAVHYTFYEFADVEEARELTDSDKIKPLIADLDRVWGTGYLGGERSWRLFRR